MLFKQESQRPHCDIRFCLVISLALQHSIIFGRAQSAVETRVVNGYVLTETLDGGNYTDDTTWVQTPCPVGFYCPGDGSRRVCRSPAHYCPGNASDPIPVENGYFTTLETVSGGNVRNETIVVDTNTRQQLCPLGYFCTYGIRQPCPSGTYGTLVGLTSRDRCMTCPAGYYCPPATIQPRKCGGTQWYCPQGSGKPQTIDSESDGTKEKYGYYSDSPETTSRYTSTWCFVGSLDCDYRPFISDTVHQLSTGVELTSSLYLHKPTIVGDEETRSLRSLCQPGFYCVNGLRYECPPGRFGSSGGLATPYCSGECKAGYYCPAGSTNSTQHSCGQTGAFCPRGSGSPHRVPPGHYSSLGPQNPVTGWTSSSDRPFQNIADSSDENFWYWRTIERYFDQKVPVHRESFTVPDPATWFLLGIKSKTANHAGQRTHALACERGHYCTADGVKRICPAGTYGAVSGLSTHICSGLCHSGFYCPPGSTSAREIECGGSNYYCPIGSGLPIKVTQGYYSVGTGHLSGSSHAHRTDFKIVSSNTTRVDQDICPKGHYCLEGVKFQCPAGRFGNTTGLLSPDCSGACSPGYFCPPGSTSSQQQTCGSVVGLNPVLNSFREQSSETPGYDSTCVTHQLPFAGNGLSQFFEFSLLSPLDSPYDTTKWDQTKNTVGGVENTMKWNEQERAFQSDGKGTHIGTTWRFGSGPKTACMWKKFTTSWLYGLDGYYRKYNSNDNFLFGTYFSFTSRIYVGSGHSYPTYADETTSVHKNEWVFYCLSSEGQNGRSMAFLATPLHAFSGPELVWNQTDNGQDIGVIPGTNPLGMVYGTTSTFRVDEEHRHTKQPHSIALYGGMIHWSKALTREEIVESYRVLSKFYPGHGGRRNPNQIRCGQYDTSEWAQGYLGRHQGVLAGTQQHRHDTTHEYTTRVVTGGDLRQRGMGPGSIAWESGTVDILPSTKATLGTSTHGGSSNRQFEFFVTPAHVYCPVSTGYPKQADSGFYTIQTTNVLDSDSTMKHPSGELKHNTDRTQDAQLPCEKGYWCQGGLRKACDAGLLGSRERETSPFCGGYCPAGHYCPVASASAMPCPTGTYAIQGSSVCASCPKGSKYAFGEKVEQQQTCYSSKSCCFD